ncbi:MAG: DNA polymerase III subunit delta [Bacilli bacterium]|jgi:DNA polymerase-3 subunit delta|nr:DNA polymerase III subunit delta [Bacilli bacterium]
MNVYLFETSSRILLEEQIAKILKGSTNKIIYNAEISTMEDILEEASYVSMFGEMKYCIVKNANFFGSSKLKEKEEELLLNYLENPYPLCTLIFTTFDSVDSRKKITKLVKEKFTYQKIVTPKGLELYNKVASLLVEKKYLAEKDTINYLINACLNNYDLIYNEIEKIDLYYESPTKIKLENVKNIVSRTLTDNNFKFVDAVMNKDLKKATQYLEDLMTLKVEPLSLINLLAREYRNMLILKTLEQEKYLKKDILSQLQLQEWQYEKTSKNASNYHADDLRDYLVSLEKLDYQIKSGQIDKLIGLKLFLLDLYEY